MQDLYGAGDADSVCAQHCLWYSSLHDADSLCAGGGGLLGGNRQGRRLAEPPAGLADIQSCGDDADCADRPLVCADGGEPRRVDLGGSGH